MKDPILEALSKLGESIDNSKTLAEISVAFEAIIKVVSETKALTQQEIQNLREMFVNAQDELKTNTVEKFDVLKARLTSYCKDEMSKLEKSHQDMMQKCEDKMAEMKDGEDADEEVIVGKVISILDERDANEPEEPEETPEEIRDMVVEAGLEIENINKLPEKLKELEEKGTTRVIGGKQGIHLYVGGVKKGLAQYIDIVAGPNVTVSDNIVNGLHTITISSTGGSGFTQLSATETPDGSRTQFTFSSASAQPSFLVIDNVWMKATTATGGVNWTWNGGTKKATLTVPAIDDIWGVA